MRFSLIRERERWQIENLFYGNFSKRSNFIIVTQILYNLKQMSINMKKINIRIFCQNLPKPSFSFFYKKKCKFRCVRVFKAN
jgi:hypothetical protein